MKQAKTDRDRDTTQDSAGRKVILVATQRHANAYGKNLFEVRPKMREAPAVTQTPTNATRERGTATQAPLLSDEITTRFPDGFRNRLNLAAARAKRKPTDYVRAIVMEAVEASEAAALAKLKQPVSPATTEVGQ